MNVSEQIVTNIIKKQEDIIGPMAFEQARKVPGLIINEKESTVQLSGNEKNVIENLVEKYKELFGKASVEVCKEAAKDLLPQLPKENVPSILM